MVSCSKTRNGQSYNTVTCFSNSKRELISLFRCAMEIKSGVARGSMQGLPFEGPGAWLNNTIATATGASMWLFRLMHFSRTQEAERAMLRHPTRRYKQAPVLSDY